MLSMNMNLLLSLGGHPNHDISLLSPFGTPLRNSISIDIIDIMKLDIQIQPHQGMLCHVILYYVISLVTFHFCFS